MLYHNKNSSNYAHDFTEHWLPWAMHVVCNEGKGSSGGDLRFRLEITEVNGRVVGDGESTIILTIKAIGLFLDSFSNITTAPKSFTL